MDEKEENYCRWKALQLSLCFGYYCGDAYAYDYSNSYKLTKKSVQKELSHRVEIQCVNKLCFIATN